MALQNISCVAAMDSFRGIGKNQTLPWHLPKEYKHFVKVTSSTKDANKRNAVILGKSTWISVPEKFRPLKNRLNVVLSTTIDKSLIPDGVLLCDNLTDALKKLSMEPYASSIESIHIVGGAGVYKEAIASGLCNRIYLTLIEGDFQCDVFFPTFDSSQYVEVSDDDIPAEVQEEKGIKYRFAIYEKQDFGKEE